MATKRPSLKQGMKPAGGADRAAEVARDLAASLRPPTPKADTADTARGKSLVLGVRFDPELYELVRSVALARAGRSRTAVSMSDVVRSLVEKAADELRGELGEA